MLLAIDVGNTQTVLGVYDGGSLVAMWRTGTDETKTADEIAVMLRGMFSLEGIDAQGIDGSVLSTVVPAQRALWSHVCAQVFHVDLLNVCDETVAHIIDVQATGAGADRLANAIAAKSEYGSPVIVVDMGTATDVEVVDEQGCFIGGIIAPGLETSLRSLVKSTALLPEIELADPGAAIGASTVEAIQIGMAVGEVERIDGLIRRMWKQLGYETPVVATGGLSERLGSLCSTVTAVNPELTLQGLRIVYEGRRR